jgi:dolichyl-phosphate beta-glucosyltransferase
MSYADFEQWKATPIQEEPFLSVVIPAYNEEVRILPTIGAIASHVSGLGVPWELILADDGSRDSTADLVEELGFANLRVLRAERNGGKGSAVRRGVLASRGQYILFADADNSTPIEELDSLLQKVHFDGYDIAVGSRAAAGAQETNRTPLRRVLSAGLRWLVRNVLSIGVLDTQCGFKLYTRDAAHRLHLAQTIMGFSFDLEILYLAARAGYRIAEVPVAWVDSPGSKLDTSKEAQRFLRDLVKIKMNDVRGIYSNAPRVLPVWASA